MKKTDNINPSNYPHSIDLSSITVVPLKEIFNYIKQNKHFKIKKTDENLIRFDLSSSYYLNVILKLIFNKRAVLIFFILAIFLAILSNYLVGSSGVFFEQVRAYGPIVVFLYFFIILYLFWSGFLIIVGIAIITVLFFLPSKYKLNFVLQNINENLILSTNHKQELTKIQNELMMLINEKEIKISNDIKNYASKNKGLDINTCADELGLTYKQLEGWIQRNPDMKKLIINLKELPGVKQDTIAKLKKLGIRTTEELLNANTEFLINGGISKKTADSIKTKAKRYEENKVSTYTLMHLPQSKTEEDNYIDLASVSKSAKFNWMCPFCRHSNQLYCLSCGGVPYQDLNSGIVYCSLCGRKISYIKCSNIFCRKTINILELTQKNVYSNGFDTFSSTITVENILDLWNDAITRLMEKEWEMVYIRADNSVDRAMQFKGFKGTNFRERAFNAFDANLANRVYKKHKERNDIKEGKLTPDEKMTNSAISVYQECLKKLGIIE